MDRGLVGWGRGEKRRRLGVFETRRGGGVTEWGGGVKTLRLGIALLIIKLSAQCSKQFWLSHSKRLVTRL